MRRVIAAAACLTLLLAISSGARAGFEEGLDAYHRGDFERAVAEWAPLAEVGDRTAQLYLGSLYEKGRGVEADSAEAWKWYTLAGERKVRAGARRARTLQASMSPEEIKDARTRVEEWTRAFADVEEAPTGPAHGDVIAFHEGAIRNTLSHPDNDTLKILCSHKIRDAYVTFVTHDEEHVLLVAITSWPLRAASKDISLDMFAADHRGPGRSTATMDWAYVYDRNRDGRVDYFTYLDGPNAVVPEPRPASLPAFGQPISGREMRYLMDHMQLVFWHLADDNFDGLPDAYLVPTRDRRSGWIDGHMLARSTGYDTTLDGCQFLPGASGTDAASCRQSPTGYAIPGKELSGILQMAPTVSERNFLALINEAARECGLTSRRFRAK